MRARHVVISFFGMLCAFHGAHASTQLSISPAVSSVVIEKGESKHGQFTLTRNDANDPAVFHVTTEIENSVSGVSVHATDLSMDTGVESASYAYSIECSDECSGNGKVRLTLTPEDSTEHSGISAQIAIVHTVDVTVSAEHVAESVDAMNIVGLNDIVTLNQPTLQYSADHKNIIVTLTSANAGDQNILHLPYSITVIHNAHTVFTQTSAFNELQAHDSISAEWSYRLPESGTYDVHIEAAGESYTLSAESQSHASSYLWIGIAIAICGALIIGSHCVRKAKTSQVL